MMVSVPSVCAKDILFINQPAFEFIMECQSCLQKGGNNVGRLKQIGVLYRNSTPEITEGLKLIDSRLDNLDFTQPNQATVEALGDILSVKDCNIQNGDYFLELGESFLTGDVKSVLHEPNGNPAGTCSRFQDVLISPLFKASCAATASGIITYCALRFYNKDKAKEQHYSPIKWSLGMATIVGAGTYWWLR